MDLPQPTPAASLQVAAMDPPPPPAARQRASVLDLSSLNPAQAEAVRVGSGVIIILAGPGSGKTKTITHRVAWMITDQHLSPYSIVLVTFTNKAAAEMKQRVCQLVGAGVADKVLMGTFHSVCCRHLRRYGGKIGLDCNFTIKDTDDGRKIIKNAIVASKMPVHAKQMSQLAGALQHWISEMKNRRLTPDSCLTASLPDNLKNVLKKNQPVYALYEGQLRAQNALDFDDLLLYALELFERFPEVTRSIHSVFIDEFQDTNALQFDLTRCLAWRGQLTVVGDPDQSIYSWRHADIKGFQHVMRLHPTAQVIGLNQNYCSTTHILRISTAVISEDTERIDRKLWTDKTHGPSVIFRRLEDSEREATAVAAEISRLYRLTSGAVPLREMAVLMRTNAQSQAIEAAMNRIGIPYRLLGGARFLERMEIKDLIAYMRLAQNPLDSISFERVANVPRRNIGNVTMADITAECTRSSSAFYTVIVNELGRSSKSSRSKKKAKNPNILNLAPAVRANMQIMISLLNNMHRLSKDQPAADILKVIIDGIQYKEYLESSHKLLAEGRWENVQELVNMATRSDQLWISCHKKGEDTLDGVADSFATSPGDGTTAATAYTVDVEVEGDTSTEQNATNDAETPLMAFLEAIALNSSQEDVSGDSKASDAVTLCTIHAAKGLEWTSVFLVGVQNNLIPHSAALKADEERDVRYSEERRLFYVTIFLPVLCLSL
jgi:DNA helicase-2/ATP-dependent DNA helicase PcrA